MRAFTQVMPGSTLRSLTESSYWDRVETALTVLIPVGGTVFVAYASVRNPLWLAYILGALAGFGTIGMVSYLVWYFGRAITS